jgi:hypothetical protein
MAIAETPATAKEPPPHSQKNTHKKNLNASITL